MIYTRIPKRSCPRDLGTWYCTECTENHLEEQSWLDYPIPLQGCDKSFGDKICGETHLGYEWCEECQSSGRTKPHPHIGEFEVVGRVHTKIQEETK